MTTTHYRVYNSRLVPTAGTARCLIGYSDKPGEVRLSNLYVGAPYARRLLDIEPFRVVEVLSRATALAAQGRDIVHLEAGEPDFSTAQPIIDAAKAALDKGLTAYTAAVGIPELREAIAGWYAQQYGITVAPQRILITPGASGALLLIAAALLDPGKGLLMTDPGYPCNRHFLRLVEAEGQLVPVGPEDNYQLTAAKAEQHWRENTSGILVASPANPTGSILSRFELAGLAALCARKGGHLVVDEIYHGLTYDGLNGDGRDAPSILEITDQAFVINSFSKYFGMTGWRLGWLVAPEAAVPHLEKLAQNLFISMSTPAQYGALAGFGDVAQAIFRERRQEFGRRRDFLLGELRRLGFIIPHAPEGALYLYADVTAFTDDGERFCLEMLEQHGIAITPGTDFGRFRAREHVRFAYTTGMPRLEEAVRRFEKIFGR
jgi:aspartate/methionine/tyrosine aminotransferase